MVGVGVISSSNSIWTDYPSKRINPTRAGVVQ